MLVTIDSLSVLKCYLVCYPSEVVKVPERAKGHTYKGIKRLIGSVPLFKTTAQPIAGFFPYLA